MPTESRLVNTLDELFLFVWPYVGLVVVLYLPVLIVLPGSAVNDFVLLDGLIAFVRSVFAEHCSAFLVFLLRVV